MKKDFKYPLLQTFFDADGIACVFQDEVKRIYPRIEDVTIQYNAGDGKVMDRDFNSFGWDISTQDGTRSEIVMASDDAEIFIRLYRRIKKRCEELGYTQEDFNEFDISICGICSVCDELLMPDDELYVDGNTGESLCDGHSIYDEEKDFYIKSV